MKFYTTSKISENMHETPEGYLVCVGVPIARTGEMVYAAGETPIKPGPDGMVLIQRDSAEVFRPETIASFEGKSVTLAHPQDFVDPANWSELTNGVAQNVRRGEGAQSDDLVADLLITVQEAIKAIKNGLREVSCGYEADYIETGIGRGVQKNIIGNHIALVEEGRAGSSYAINDHKGKGSHMKVGEKIKAIFAKAQDEALKAAETADANMETPEKKEGFVCIDDMKKYLDEKFDNLMGKKEEKKADDASSQPAENEPAKIVAKDAEEEMEKKKAARDAWIDAQMEKESKDAAEEEGESEEAEDDDFEESSMVGDTASRIEILAPGMKAKGKDAKAKALIAAYATVDGKAIVDGFMSGKTPDFKNESQVETLFLGVSEVLKVRRNAELAKSKTHDDFTSNLGQPKGVMSPEKMNEINKKHYSNRN